MTSSLPALPGDDRNELRIGLLAADRVGCEIGRVIARGGDRLCSLVVDPGSDATPAILELLEPLSDRVLTNEELTKEQLEEARPDLLLLAWWPHILPGALLSIPRLGSLNFHPSLLPQGRGKHPNFWALKEGSPYGVTIHHATEAVDAGDVAFQRELETDWTDTGETLHHRAQDELIELFEEVWPRIRSGDIPKSPQGPGDWVTHRASELEDASRIDLDGTYRARDLLNLIRARTYPPRPGAWFVDDGKRYEVRISIDPAGPSDGS